MEEMIPFQLPLVEHVVLGHKGELLAKMAEILDGCKEAGSLAHRDITQGLSWRGAERLELNGEQALRVYVVKMMTGLSYRELAFTIEDSRTLKAFCRFGIGDTVPGKSVLARSIKCIGPTTLEAVHHALLRLASEEKVEDGRMLRADCTVTETNIHRPTDSSVLADGVRVLCRCTWPKCTLA